MRVVMERIQGSVEDGLPGQSSVVAGASYLFRPISADEILPTPQSCTMWVVTSLGLQGGHKRKTIGWGRGSWREKGGPHMFPLRREQVSHCLIPKVFGGRRTIQFIKE